MPTTADYLSDLIVQKNELVQKLNIKGVSASQSETLNSLIPKLDNLYTNAMKNFADILQNYGSRRSYSGLFYSLPNIEILRYFRYNIYADYCDNMFFNAGKNTGLYPDGFDLTQILSDTKISISWGSSGIITSTGMFQDSRVKRVPSLFFSGASLPSRIFMNCQLLKTIDGLQYDGKNTASHFFMGCKLLENIKFFGFWYADIDLSQSPKLTVETILSLFNAMYNYSGSTTVHTATLGSTNLAKLTDEQKAIATDKGWTLV